MTPKISLYAHIFAFIAYLMIFLELFCFIFKLLGFIRRNFRAILKNFRVAPPPRHGRISSPVDVSKKIHLKQLSKKSKINTIFGTSSTVITIIVLVISAILLQRFCTKKYGRIKNNVTHLNRINENLLFKEDPIPMRQALSKGTSNVQTQREISNETTTTTDAAEPSGIPINLSSIIRTVSS